MLTPVVVVVAAVGAAAVATVALRRRRRDVWRRFAGRHGLELGRAGDGVSRIEGTIGGRRVRVEPSSESSDTGVLGVELVELSLGTSAPAPPDLRIRQRAVTMHAVGGGELETGDERFDRIAHVECDDPDAARRFLGEGRRDALVALLDVDAMAGLEGPRLYVRRRRAVARLGVLEADLALLRRTADRIEP